MITGHADAQRERNQRLAQQKTNRHPPVKCLARQQRTGTVLEHGVRVRFRRKFSSFQTHNAPRAMAQINSGGKIGVWSEHFCRESSHLPDDLRNLGERLERQMPALGVRHGAVGGINLHHGNLRAV